MTRTILDVVKDCDNFISDSDPKTQIQGLQNYYAFKVNGCSAPLGYIPQIFINKIQWTDSWSINHQQQTVLLNTPHDATTKVRSQVVAETLKATKALDVISILKSWRGENFPVYGRKGEVLLEIERCASSLFGILTYGVQLLCYVKEEGGLLLWIAKRSKSKQTYPGMLDCTAAGGLPAGKLPIEAIICEAQEEASIPDEIMKKKLQSTGYLTYFHIRGSKAGGEVGLLQPEIEYTYELELDSSMAPRPGDSEVENFFLYTIGDVLLDLKRGLFKPNSAIVVVHFLIQRGIINPENEPGYFQILSHLHRQLEFPVVIHDFV